MSGNSQLRPLPPALPATRDQWRRILKTARSLNDDVEDMHLLLLEDEDEETRERYSRFLYATWDEQAVEGSQAADNLEAANMIREKAMAVNPKNLVTREKKTTIVKALNVVLKRYGQSRSERRNMLSYDQPQAQPQDPAQPPQD